MPADNTTPTNTAPTNTAPTNEIVDLETFRSARRAHLDEEKAFTRARDALAARRRELPWLELGVDYRFEGPDGEVGLDELFAGHRQLLIYHFMFGPDWDEGCPNCSFWADNYNGTPIHLRHRDTRFVAVSRAPLAKLEAYKERMGWDFDWYSSLDDFNFDLGVSFTPEQVASGEPLYNHGTMQTFGEESPGLSALRREGGAVYLTYQAFARGLDMFNGAYHHLDATSLGRDEDDLPWTMAWLRRNDEY